MNCWCGHSGRDHTKVGPNRGCRICKADMARPDWAHAFERVSPNAHITTAHEHGRVRSCLVKTRRYETLRIARVAARIMERKHPGEWFDAYPCRWDVEGNRHFHVGHASVQPAPR